MAIIGKNIIGSTLSVGANKTFKAINPTDLQYLEGIFYEASEQDVNNALKLAADSFMLYKNTTAEQRAIFLETIASEIEALGDELVKRAMSETALPESRIISERKRTTGQLLMFANLLREGSWVEATIETGLPVRQPLPKPDLRNMLKPIGPVVVFSASNFPLAFSVAGGDTVSALAAGNPVIVKAHSAHPGTSDLVAHAILKAAKQTAMPDGVFSHLFDTGFFVGEKLVSHPLTCAVGFTGSLTGGRALFDIASKRAKPIPVFAEMGSTNPVFLLEDILKEQAEKIASQLSLSVTQAVGQFCTKPGLIIAQKSEAFKKFEQFFASEIDRIQSGSMLNERIAVNYKAKVEKINKSNIITWFQDTGLVQQETGFKARPIIASVGAKTFIANPLLHEELFGPFALIVVCESEQEMQQVAAELDGQLTITIFSTEQELGIRNSLVNYLQEKAGRLIFNGVPTGVEVCSAMQHGGPYPASTDSRFTSVGTKSILRWVRPVAYQNWPDKVLPVELQNANPKGILRQINGVYSNNKIE